MAAAAAAAGDGPNKVAEREMEEAVIHRRVCAYLDGGGMMWIASVRAPGTNIYGEAGLEFDAQTQTVRFWYGRGGTLTAGQTGRFAVLLHRRTGDSATPTPPPPGYQLLYTREGGAVLTGKSKSAMDTAPYTFDGDARLQTSPHRMTSFYALIELDMRRHPFGFYDFGVPDRLADCEYAEDEKLVEPLAPFSSPVTLQPPVATATGGGEAAASKSGSGGSGGETVDPYPRPDASVVVSRNGERRYLLSVALNAHGIFVAGVHYSLQQRKKSKSKSSCIIA